MWVPLIKHYIVWQPTLYRINGVVFRLELFSCCSSSEDFGCFRSTYILKFVFNCDSLECLKIEATMAGQIFFSFTYNIIYMNEWQESSTYTTLDGFSKDNWGLTNPENSNAQKKIIRKKLLKFCQNLTFKLQIDVYIHCEGHNYKSM